MAIEIHVTDPANLTPTEARALSNLFLQMAGLAASDAAITVHGDVTLSALKSMITEDDNPATGAKTAAEVFGGHLNVINDPAIQSGAPGNDLPPASAVFGQPSAPAPITPPPSPAPQSASSIPAPPAAPLSPPAGAIVDKRGLPWDGRIHASTKTQTVKGEWKMKKGVDATIVPGIEAELRAVMAAPVPNVIPPPPPSPDAQTSSPPVVNIVTDPALTTAGSAPVGVPPTIAPPPLPPANAPAIGFGMLVARVTADMNSGVLTQARVMEVLISVGMPALPSLIQRPDLIPTVATQLGYV